MATPGTPNLRKVVYDDQDSNIQYGGEWFEMSGTQGSPGNYGTPYLNTLHGTHHDANISLEFDGATVVEVYGTNYPSNPKSDPDPNFECFIDGVSIGRESPSDAPDNNWELCVTYGLSAGQHKLRIDIKVRSPKQTFWLDRIEYAPSPSVSPDNFKVIKFMNVDPAIRLDDSWSLFGPIKVTSVTNAVAHVDFTGTSISWVGRIPTQNFSRKSAFGTWSIDNGKAIEFILAGLLGGPNSTEPERVNNMFFQTTEFENGPHTLTVTFLGSEDTTPLTLDHLFIKTGSILTTNTSTPNPPTPPASSTTETSTVTPPTPNIATTSASVNVGALLGGVLGSLGVFVLIAGAFLYRRHRRLSRKDVVRPFYRLGGLPNTIDQNGTAPNMMAQPTYGDVALPVNQLAAKRRETLRVEAQSGDRSYSRQPIVASGAGDNSGMVHSNSGIRLNQQALDENPPYYTLE